VKAFWILNLEVGVLFHKKYKDDLERDYSKIITQNSSKTISIIDILHQIFEYLVQTSAVI